MSAKQYPFIDVAVHERVRLPFARGEAVVLFSKDMSRVLWSNGRGAALFGEENIYDFLDAGPDRGDITFRQLSATARQVQLPGDRRSLVMRIGSGFRSMPVTATVEAITIRPGDEAILFHTPVAGGRQSQEETAVAMLAGFDDPDTHMAVLDEEGTVIAGSDGFDRLAISIETRRALVQAAGRSPEHLVKRPVATGRGHLPAAIGRISSDPALHLLFAVETILGHLDPDEEEAAPAVLQDVVEPEIAVEPSATETFPAQDEPLAETVEMEAELEPIPNEAEPEIAAGIEDPTATPGGVEETVIDEATPQHAHEPANPIAELVDLSSKDAPTEPVEEIAHETAGEETNVATTDETASGFLFNRQGRPIRFVWKIDAEGRFSEISEEFAAAVGPQAAAISGARFVDVAARFDLDLDGKIGDLLSRRDTWSGKTIFWPVEGTSLVVPVDLAALPTYSRNREFDGFRGFGIVRIADAVEDAHARGLMLGDVAETQEEVMVDRLDEADQTAEAAVDETPAVSEETNGEIDAPSASEQDDNTADASVDIETGATPLVGDDEPDAFRGERPALRLVETPNRRHSDKVVQLETRRNRGGLFDGLSTGEQAAFREIARQLGESFGKRKPEDRPVDDAANETPANIPAESADVNEDTVDTILIDTDETEAEMPGLEIGPHADDLLTDDHGGERTAIAPPRTQMDYGLNATVVDALPVALLVHVGDRLIHANPEFFRFSGYRSLEDLEASGGLDILLAAPDEDTEDGDGTMALRHADGESTSAVRARLQSIRWEDGTALMLALTPAHEKPALTLVESVPAPVVDTDEPTADQAAAAALRIEISELRSILETATDGVVVVGQDGDIRSMNRSASALFNYDEDETRGRPFAMLFAHESQKAVLDYLAGLSGHGVASVLNDGREVIGREAAGGFIPLFMTMGRLSSSSGFCAVIRDITQWKRTEEELRSAKRAAETANAHKSDFLARVSHEIRTPLNAIIGFSDMMATERFGPIGHPRYIEYANDIGRSGRHVLDIVNDLLDISKIEAGEMDLEFTAVGLNETISEAVSLVQPQANGQRVIIRTSLSNNVPQIVADLRSIKQIALNILSNAIRFTPSGGQIVVSTAYEANGSVVLRIRDTGVGMTRSELEQAMKPFRQVTTGARKRGDGTGLGLPLTKAMVDANRASFSISSTPNEGTLVEVSFPSPRVLAD
ncbi:PAS domain S-box protein [Shinella sp. CPCC 101442]|uniref:ATP-binding protein n=1 Tax=Shinella sp. CPCC 101442 TaxID=2932265 RepID=UPI00215349CF|nr:ATP-binding protein [Shinella sp. CPCC 101442]MCR6501101.1 PAS domain S-box protein [Shinella sp. CPCC 101442]